MKIFLVFLLFNLSLFAQGYGQWEMATPMNLARQYFSSVVLPDGNVFVAGGFSDSVITKTCEIYNSSTNTWKYVSSMNIPRESLRLILLDSSRVMAIGGYNLKSCEIYNIQKDQWTFTDSLKISRKDGWTVNKLSDGEIIIAGGFTTSKDLKTLKYLKDTEIFDPSIEKWRVVDSLKIGRAYHTSTLLTNGNLFVVGGDNNGIELKDCEEFNHLTEKWMSADSLNTARYNQSAILLSNGTVLISGGENDKLNPSSPWLSSCEIYYPSQDKWDTVTSMYIPREFHSSVLLNNGLVLFFGGDMGENSWELYNPDSLENVYFGTYPLNQSLQRVEKLLNGNVISLGGITWTNTSVPVLSPTAKCVIYSTVTGVSKERNNILQSIKLYQNYPNPFNPATVIHYELPNNGYVTLKVYDALGREVATLVKAQETQGRYEVNFDASNLASGIYFYQLRVTDPSNNANNFISTKKMLLIK